MAAEGYGSRKTGLGPKPRSYSYSINKKVKRVALKSALTAKYNDYKIYVIEDMKLDEIKTAKIAALLKGLEVDSALVVTAAVDENIYKSARNIKGVDASYVGMLSTYEILKHGALVLSKDAVEKLEEVYA